MSTSDQIDATNRPKKSRSGKAQLERMLEILALGSREPGDLRAILGAIAQAALELFEADLCVVYAVNPVSREFLPPPISPVWKGTPLPGTEIRPKMPRKDGITKGVIENEGPVFIGSMKRHRGMSNAFTDEQKIRSVVAIPLAIPGSRKPLAVVYIDFRRAHRWRKSKKDLLEQFGLQASVALQSVWFLRRYRSISKAGKEINQKVSGPLELIETLGRRMTGVIEVQHCFLLALQQRNGPQLELYGWLGDERIAEKKITATGVLRELLDPDSPTKIVNLADPPKVLGDEGSTEALRLPGPGSMLAALLEAEDEALGLLILQHPEHGVFDDEDRHLFELLASQVALACSNQRLFRDLDRLQKAGEVLTQQLESENILQEVADRIQETAGADLVILYSFFQSVPKFDLPPTHSGTCEQTDLSKQTKLRKTDIAWLGLRHGKEIYAQDSGDLFRLLGGKTGRRVGDFERREGIVSLALLPLEVAGECVGLLFVNFRRREEFPVRQRQMLEGLARYAAIAIRNARAFGSRAMRPLREQEILREVDKMLIETADLEPVLLKILELVNQLLQADEASVLLFNVKTRCLETSAAIGHHAEVSKKQQLPIYGGKGLTVQAFKRKKSILAEDVRTDEWAKQFVSVGADTVSELDVPMWIGKAVIGVLNFESRSPNSFDRNDQRFLEILAGQAVLAVRRAQDHEKVKRLAKERSALIGLSYQLAREDRPEALYQLIVERALEVTTAKAGVLTLVDDRRSKLKVVAEKGAGDLRIPRYLPRRGLIWKAARDKGSVLAPDVRRSPYSEEFLSIISGTRSALAMPILEGDSVRGVLNIESPFVGFFSAADERLMETLADVTLLAIQNQERLQRAEDRSRRLKAVHRLSQQVLSLDGREELIRAVAENAAELTDADFVDLDLYENGERTRVYQVERVGGEISSRWLDLEQEPVQHLERGLMDWVAEHRQAYVSNDDVRKNPLYRGADDIRSELIVPMETSVDGELVGVLNAESRQLYAFDKEAVEIFELLASEAVVAIQNAKSFAALQKEKDRFQSLFDAGRSLAGVADSDEVQGAYDVVIEIASRHCNCSKVVIRRLDEKRNELVARATSRGIDPEPFPAIPVSEGLNGWVAREKEPALVADADLLPDGKYPAAWRSDEKDRSFAIVPVIFGEGRYYGNLALSDPCPGRFAEIDLALLRGLARQLGLTLHRLEELESRLTTERLAQEDWMMNLAGRQSLEVTHRLKNNLGWVPNKIERYWRRERKGTQNPGALEELLNKIQRDVSRVLAQGKGIAQGLKANQGLERTTIAGQQLLEDALQNVRVPHGIEIQWNTDDYRARVRVVYRGLVDALGNLMTNAVEAMAAGGVLTLSVARKNESVELRVTDTGPGIPPEIEKNPFGLGETSRIEGSGLGLASASRNVWADVGTIEVEKTGIEGTTFLIRLPAVGGSS